jgi:2-keto-3-deoxy-6-phosphogluconate aldolase
MMAKHKVMAALRESGVVAVISTDNPGDLVAVSKALNQGGVNFVEITMTVPGASDGGEGFRAHHGIRRTIHPHRPRGQKSEIA